MIWLPIQLDEKTVIKENNTFKMLYKKQENKFAVNKKTNIFDFLVIEYKSARQYWFAESA